MSIEKIAKLRNVQQFTPWEEWDNNLNTNCIAYALGLMIDDPKKEIFQTLLLENPIKKLSRVFEELGFSYRRINPEVELENGEYGIVLYHYFYKATYKICGFYKEFDCEETHLARIEPNGIWTHKFGWDYQTSQTTPEEIHKIILEDDKVDVSPTAYFAVKKPL